MQAAKEKEDAAENEGDNHAKKRRLDSHAKKKEARQPPRPVPPKRCV
jgi:hypothetical protein